MVGETIGKYKIIKEIGSGGMGTVYEAYQESLNRSVAIKILPQQLSKDKELVERFQREAKAAAHLSHPRIVQIYDIGEEKGVYYFAMELLKGRPLNKVIKEQGALPIEQTLEIAEQITEALKCAHSEKLIHRDIKPSNIMVDENNQVKVTDFGIAKAIQFKDITITGTILGTPEYMSPEQAKGEKIDVRSDIYSLGIVMYEMVTGKVPFSAETPYGVIQQQITKEPVPISKINSSVTKELEYIVNKCIAKDQSLRYQSADELIRDIKDYKSGVIYQRTLELAPSIVKRFKLKGPLLIVASLGIVAIILGYFFTRQMAFKLRPAIMPPTPTADTSITPSPEQVVPDEEKIKGLLSKGDRLFKEEKYGEAILTYQTVINDYPVSKWADESRKRIKYVQEKIEEGKLEALFNNANDLENKNENVKAVSVYQEIIVKAPTSEWAQKAKEAIAKIEKEEKAKTERLKREDLLGPEEILFDEVDKMIEKDLKIMGFAMKGDKQVLADYLNKQHFDDIKRIADMVGLKPDEFAPILANIIIQEGFGMPRDIGRNISDLIEIDPKNLGPLVRQGDVNKLARYLKQKHLSKARNIAEAMGVPKDKNDDEICYKVADEIIKNAKWHTPADFKERIVEGEETEMGEPQLRYKRSKFPR